MGTCTQYIDLAMVKNINVMSLETKSMMFSLVLLISNLEDYISLLCASKSELELCLLSRVGWCKWQSYRRDQPSTFVNLCPVYERKHDSLSKTDGRRKSNSPFPAVHDCALTATSLNGHYCHIRLGCKPRTATSWLSVIDLALLTLMPRSKNFNHLGLRSNASCIHCCQNYFGGTSPSMQRPTA